MPYFLQMALTACRLAMLTGCPPPELLVTVIMTNGILATPFSRIVGSSAATFILPLKGKGTSGSLPSSQIRSIPSAPENSMLARVVSKRVLLIKYFPFPPRAENKIFSEALPWWVGITKGIPVMRLTMVSKR